MNENNENENTKKRGALLLLPNLLFPHKYHTPYLPSSIDKAVESLDGLIAESEKEGRRFLSRFKTIKPIREMPIALYNEHTKEEDIDFLLAPLKQKERWGYVSDAGLPCIADPGHQLVRRARQMGIQVQAFVGPSAILLSLMLSGLPGQNFSFHGYLSSDKIKRRTQLLELERQARTKWSTQIFIEAPYRNQYLLEALLNTLQDDTWLCIAWEITSPEQGVICQPMAQWKKSTLPNLDKKAAIFLIGQYKP